jgi:GTP-binding protein Era
VPRDTPRDGLRDAPHEAGGGHPGGTPVGGPVIVEPRFKNADKATMAAKEKAAEAERQTFIKIGEGDYLLPSIQLLNYDAKQHQFREIIPISARKREGLDVLMEKMIAALPEGPRYFPEDQITDQPVRFMAAELIREQLLMATSEEVPHSVTVVIEQFEEGAKLTRIAAAIFCERESQKGILIGRQGQMLKKIGTAARLEIERMVGTKVFLELFVKVQPKWRESRAFVEEMDWRRQLEHLVTVEKA